MISAAIKIKSSPLANFNIPNWENIETTIIYPSNSTQNITNNPPNIHDIIIDTLGNVWSINSLVKQGSTLNYTMNLLLKSDIPSVDIAPNFGDTKAGIITPNSSNEVAPYWDSSFVDINVLKISAQYNNSLSPTNNLSAIKTVDGAGSGLDSDTIDGLDSTAFSLVGHTHLNVTNTIAGFMSSSDKIKLDAITGTNTGDQTFTLLGDATGSGTNNISVTLATITDAGTGTFKKITTNTKGLVTGTAAVVQADIIGLIGASSITNTMLANSAVANLAGTNTGDETTSSIKTKLGIVTLSGSNTGDQTNITGNAATATSLQTTRTINGISFDGSANITINAVDSTPRIASSLIGAANGVAPLDATSKILSSYLPSYVDVILEFTSLANFPVIGIATTIYVALDTNKSYRWSGSTYVFMTSGAVDSVAGRTGAIVLTKNDVGLNNVNNVAQLADTQTLAITGDITATPTALSTGSIATTLAASGVTAGTYNNSSSAITPFVVDAKGRITSTSAAVTITPAWSSITSKPTTLIGYGITDAAPLTNPVFTGTVSGITKTMVGLGNVDNTSDISKPVSTAQATANSIVQSTAASDATTKANAAQAAAIAASAPLTHVHSAVTTTVNGFMIAADKVKLDAFTFRNTSITSNNLTTTLDDFLMSSYRSAEYTVQISQGGNYIIVKLLVIHNGTTVFINEYGSTNTSLSIGTLDAIISSGSILLQLSNFGNATTSTIDVKLSRIVLAL